MNEEDRQAIAGLFDRLRQVEARAAPREPEAEALIRAAVAAQPAAPYYMAQTIVVQNQALAEAQRRIAELEDEGRQERGGLFSSLFGGEDRRSSSRVPDSGPAGRSQGGFLVGAAQTAVGVVGGMLLGNLIAGSPFGHGSAEAAAPVGEPGGGDADPGADIGGDSDVGDFDIGF